MSDDDIQRLFKLAIDKDERFPRVGYLKFGAVKHSIGPESCEALGAAMLGEPEGPGGEVWGDWRYEHGGECRLRTSDVWVVNDSNNSGETAAER